MKIIHIGLGKAGSTTLQEIIFPKICKKYSINFINLNNYKNYDFEHSILEKQTNFEKKLPEKFLISQEDLIADPSGFISLEKSFQILKKNFSKSTKVLIILRNPYDYLNSIFLHDVQTLIASKEKEYFYIDSNKSIKNYLVGKYNLFNFNYKNIILLYKSYFTNLTIIPFEKISNMNFLDELLDNNVDEKFKNQLAFDYKKKKYNIIKLI